jgi:hypothetical protein
MHVMVLSRDAAGHRLAERRVCEGERRVRHGKKAAGSHRLFQDEDILREVSRQRVSDGDLSDPPTTVGITLPVVDGRVIDGGLNDVSLARVVSIRQLLAYFDKRYAALVAENQGKTLEVPAIHLRVRWALLNELDEGGANSRRIHSGQHLTRPRTRNRHSPHLQVSEAGPIENQGAHFRGNGRDHGASRRI